MNYQKIGERCADYIVVKLEAGLDWLERNLQIVSILGMIVVMLFALIVIWMHIAYDAEMRREAQKIEVSPNYLK
jgi:hypothetical protein